MGRAKGRNNGSSGLSEPGEVGVMSEHGTRSTWILLTILFAATVFFAWGAEARVPWVLRVLEWAAIVF